MGDGRNIYPRMHLTSKGVGDGRMTAPLFTIKSARMLLSKGEPKRKNN
jgi:hypothetical protein